MGATRLPDRSASQPNSQPARVVTATVPATGSPVARASGIWDSPNVADCSSRPPVGPNASVATVDNAPRNAVSSDHTVPSGISSASQRPTPSGSGRSAMAARTRGTAAAATTAAPTTLATAPPRRRPDRNGCGRRPRRVRVATASAVPRAACTTGWRRQGCCRPAVKLHATSAPASASARRRRGISAAIGIPVIGIRGPRPPWSSQAIGESDRCRPQSSPQVRRPPPIRRVDYRRSCGRGRSVWSWSW